MKKEIIFLRSRSTKEEKKRKCCFTELNKFVGKIQNILLIGPRSFNVFSFSESIVGPLRKKILPMILISMKISK